MTIIIQYTNKNPNNAFVFNLPCVWRWRIFANKEIFTTVVVFSTDSATVISESKEYKMSSGFVEPNYNPKWYLLIILLLLGLLER